jgi:hypothetical protein
MALSKQPLPITDLLLPAGLEKKIGEFKDTAELRLLRPEVVIAEWSITPAQWDRLNKALVSRGQEPLGDYVVPEKKARAASLKGLCRKEIVIPLSSRDVPEGEIIPGHGPCGRKLLEGKRSCLWHWLADQPIEVQVEWADGRRARVEVMHFATGVGPYVERARVPESEWPVGERWCSECQMFIPLFYCRGSRCIPHASRAAHASMTKRVYDFTRDDYEALLAWQKGRCYICQQVPRAKRLAVDHDHATGAVRGLLCANDEWGCNVTLRRVLNSKGMAERLLAYVQQSPLERMQAGELPVTIAGSATRAREQRQAQVDKRTLDPFAGF